MKKILSLLVFSFPLLVSHAQVAKIVHPAIGTTAYSADSTFSITLIGKKQYYAPTETATADKDINSPKSVNMHPNATKYYVNSLEGATTVVYDFKTNEKLKVIRHEFTDADTVLLGKNFKPFYKFTHYLPDSKHPASPFGGWGAFYGKPVESTFTHGGKYLWVPYYRRDYDINAQDPSAVAIIDTETDSIIRLMDTGPLPKMIATSPDGKLVAITQWGDNTVGIINIESENPFDWHYTSLAIIDQKLELNFSMTKQIDRDNESGYCLRGTAFTPDNHYLLVGCMAGKNEQSFGIAVVDLTTMQYLGRVTGNMYNMRHLLIRDGYVYLSINRDGYIQRMPLTQFLAAIPALKASASKTTSLSGWENCKVGNGARTIEFSPDGRYIYAACNASSTLYVVDTKAYQVVTSMAIDSYPVGLEVSKDGRYVFTTSQGRSNGGGNCVDIFHVYAPQEERTELLRTSQSWDGVELPPYLEGKPELVAVKYVFPAGKKVGWHHHPVMNYGVLLQGELTLIRQDGTTKVVHEGEAVVEMVDAIHRGENRGSKPVILYMFYLSQEGKELSIQHPEIPLE